MADENQVAQLRSVKLMEDKGETSRFTHAEIDDGENLVMYTTDIGKAPNEWFGDSDYEFWVTVPKEHKDKLLLVLIEKLYGGVFSAVDDFRALLDSKGVPNTFQNWS